MDSRAGASPGAVAAAGAAIADRMSTGSGSLYSDVGSLLSVKSPVDRRVSVSANGPQPSGALDPFEAIETLPLHRCSIKKGESHRSATPGKAAVSVLPASGNNVPRRGARRSFARLYNESLCGRSSLCAVTELPVYGPSLASEPTELC